MLDVELVANWLMISEPSACTCQPLAQVVSDTPLAQHAVASLLSYQTTDRGQLGEQALSITPKASRSSSAY